MRRRLAEPGQRFLSADGTAVRLLQARGEGAHGGEARLLAGSEPLELWEWSLEPGDKRAADAHRPNSREILSVTKGQVTLTVGAEEPVVLKAGQSALFCADKPHSYRNASTRRCEFLLAVHEPNGVPS